MLFCLSGLFLASTKEHTACCIFLSSLIKSIIFLCLKKGHRLRFGTKQNSPRKGSRRREERRELRGRIKKCEPRAVRGLFCFVPNLSRWPQTPCSSRFP